MFVVVEVAVVVVVRLNNQFNKHWTSLWNYDLNLLSQNPDIFQTLKHGDKNIEGQVCLIYLMFVAIVVWCCCYEVYNQLNTQWTDYDITYITLKSFKSHGSYILLLFVMS